MAEVFKLDGVALITGAASGIGQETAFLFAESGCSAVVFADINIDGAKTAAEESKSYASNPEYKTLAIHVDVTSFESVQAMLRETIESFERIDYGVHSAGIGSLDSRTVPNLNFTSFDRIIDINIKGTAHFVSALSTYMKTQPPKIYTPRGRRSSRVEPRRIGRGSIVLLASIYSHINLPGMLPYITSKHGVIGITKAAAMDLARDGIRVNAVCPTATDTPLIRKAMENKPEMGALAAYIPLEKRLATTDEVASAVMYLCTPGASFVTGEAQCVDAGFSLTLKRA